MCSGTRRKPLRQYMSRAGFFYPCDGKILKGPLGEVISNSCAACDSITGISLVGMSHVALFSNEIKHDMVMPLIRSRAMQVSRDKGNKTRLHGSNDERSSWNAQGSHGHSGRSIDHWCGSVPTMSGVFPNCGVSRLMA